MQNKPAQKRDSWTFFDLAGFFRQGFSCLPPWVSRGILDHPPLRWGGLTSLPRKKDNSSWVSSWVFLKYFGGSKKPGCPFLGKQAKGCFCIISYSILQNLNWFCFKKKFWNKLDVLGEYSIVEWWLYCITDVARYCERSWKEFRHWAKGAQLLGQGDIPDRVVENEAIRPTPAAGGLQPHNGAWQRHWLPGHCLRQALVTEQPLQGDKAMACLNVIQSMQRMLDGDC